MDTSMIVEMVGYLASFLILVSFLMSSVIWLRIVNSVGAFIFVIYALIIHSYPTAVMNLCLIIVNMYYLHKLTKERRQAAALSGEPEQSGRK